MTDMSEQEAIRIVAEFDGWEERDHAEMALHFPGGYRKTTVKRWFHSPFSPFSLPQTLPDYAHDRDALIEVAKKLPAESRCAFMQRVKESIGIWSSVSVTYDPFDLLTCPAFTLLIALAQTIKEGKL